MPLHRSARAARLIATLLALAPLAPARPQATPRVGDAPLERPATLRVSDDLLARPVALRVGDDVLERSAALRVEAQPTTCLPPRLATALTAAARSDGLALEPGLWRRVPTTDLAPELMPILMHVSDAFWDGLGAGTRVWAAQLDLPEVLAIGRVWISHEGRLTSDLRDRAASFEGAPGRAPWIDGEGAAVFLWDDVGERLLAIRSQRPGAVRLGLEVDDRSLLWRFERRLLRGGDAPVEAPDLVGPLELRDETRTAVLAPAGTLLALDVADVQGDLIALAYGLAELSESASAVRPGLAREASDGMTFTLAFDDDRGRHTLWSGAATPADGWLTARVDVTAIRGRSGVLRLLTGPGPADDAAFDHGAWASLRVLARDPPPPDRPHVVLVDVDTLRADRLGCYGYRRDTSPRLDAWAAAQAEVFRDATAVGDWTLPTTVSMLTGLATSQHGVTDVTRGLSAAQPTLAEQLRDAGYETWGRTDGGYVVPAFGFARGFDRFRVRRPDWQQHQRDGWREELSWLAERGTGRPVFLFLQTYQVHTPYAADRRFDDFDAPYDGQFAVPHIDRLLLQRALAEGREPDARDRAWVHAQYDAAVHRMDDVVGRFLEALPDVFGDEPYLVIVTSDHGEELFERGWFGHRHSLHAELLGVPLLVRHPDLARTGIVSHPVSTLDVAPTILDYAGLELAEHLPGRSLRRPPPPNELRVAFHESDAWAVMLEGLKLVVASESGDPGPAWERMRQAMFDTRVDPGERTDLLATRPERAAQLRELLHRWLERYHAAERGAEAPLMDEQLRHDLEALGYTDKGDGR